MVTRTFDDLVRDLKQRREVGDLPPVLMLGAGASVDAGIGAMADLFEFVGVPDFDHFVTYINPLTAGERYRLLARFLQTRKPAEVTLGYQALAALCADAYFDILLTTNLDPLLDDALAAAQLWRKDYFLILNGVMRPDRLELLLTAQSPRVKIVKLHGDLFSRFMAWTPAEMDNYLQDVSTALAPALRGRDVLVVGHSLRDERIRELALNARGAIWYTNPVAVPDFLAQSDRVRAVLGDNVGFEKLFSGLARALGVTTPLTIGTGGVISVPAIAGLVNIPLDSLLKNYTDITTRAPLPPAAAAATSATALHAQTVDDLIQATVAVVGSAGQLSFTGFVLADPRVIVTKGYEGHVSYVPKTATIVARDGRRFKSRVVRRGKEHPFAPLLLDVPDELRVPGLRVSTTRIEANTSVRIAIAVGERTGISSGVILEAHEQTMEIFGMGKVGNLVAIEATVAGGSSGAPVVDGNFDVCGFIVAGADNRPPALMYPTARWVELLSDKPQSRRSTRGGRKRK